MPTDTWHARLAPELVDAVLADYGGDEGVPAFLLYDLDLMTAKVAVLRTSMPGFEHAMAIKACPFLFVLKHLAGLGLSLEAASIEEVHLALAAGCPPARIVFDSPCKTKEELAFCLERGITLNLDNRSEYERVRALLAGRAPLGRIGLRVNTQVGEGAIAHTSVSGGTSKFGLSLTRNRADIDYIFNDSAIVTGLHSHVGSQGVRMEQLVESVVRLAQLADQLGAADTIGWLDIGGGLPWPYLDQPGLPTPTALHQAIRQAIPSRWLADGRLITEFGRAFFAGCAVYASRVEYVKAQGDVVYATIHAGADLFMRPTYFPDVWPHRAELHPERPRTGRVIKIAGPLCFAGDVLYADFPGGTPQAGDWLVVDDVGAYTAGTWSRHCSRAMPPVLAHKDGTVTLAKRGETPEDVVRFWS